MKNAARVTTTDAEIEAAIAQANLREDYRPKAIDAQYRENTDSIYIQFSSGIELVIPRKLLQGLESANANQLTAIEIVGAQSGLHWPQLNVDHYIPGLIEGVFGNKRWMSEIGKRGGAAKSIAKTAAVRENGRKGGRPRKVQKAA